MIWKKETEKFSVNKKLNIICFVAYLCVFLFIGAYSVQAEGKNKTVYEGCVYDFDTGFYGYSTYDSSDIIFYANILNGTYSNGSVRISAVNGTQYTVYRNGQQYDDIQDGRISEAGEYAVSVHTNSGKQETILKFTILSRFTNLKRMDLPGTCKIEKVLFNGEEISFRNTYVLFDKDGQYEISYLVNYIDKIESVTVITDNTAPVITLEGVDENNEAHGPVTILDIDEKVAMSIYKNGEKMDYTTHLYDSGNYRIIVQDEASNQTVYEFSIFRYFNMSSMLFLGFCVLILVVIVMYVVLLKKNLRVR